MSAGSALRGACATLDAEAEGRPDGQFDADGELEPTSSTSARERPQPIATPAMAVIESTTARDPVTMPCSV